MKNKIVPFDYLRTYCAVAVVAIHTFDTNPSLNWISKTFLKFPVPIFLMISFYLMGIKLYCHDDNQKAVRSLRYLQKRMQRLVPPFLVWTLVYGAVRSCVVSSNIELTWTSILSFLFFGSASIQLYYVPLVVYFSILLLPLVLAANSERESVFFVYFLSISSVFCWFQTTSLVTDIPKGTDIAIFTYYFTTYFLYALLGLYFSYVQLTLSKFVGTQKTKFLIWSILIFVVASTVWNISDAVQPFSYARNMFVFGIFFFCKSPQRGLAQKISQLSFGIFLLHPLFVEGLQLLEGSLGIALNTVWVTFGNFVIALLSSLVASSLLYKSARTRFLVA